MVRSCCPGPFTKESSDSVNAKINDDIIPEASIEFKVNEFVTIKADTWGDPAGRPVILSHGGGQTRHSWGGTAKVLAQKGWYAIAYDHRGHGESSWCPDGGYALEDFSSDLEFIASKFEQLPVLVGASLGGLSAILSQGEREEPLFAAIVLVDITHNMNVDGALNIIGFMGTHVEEGFGSLEEAADVIAEYTGRPRRKDLDGLAKNLRLGEDGRYRWHWDPQFLKARLDVSINNPNRLTDAVTNIPQPILLVRGRLSDLVTEDIAREFLQTVPHARAVDVAHARHMVAGDRNDIFTSAVTEFIEAL